MSKSSLAKNSDFRFYTKVSDEDWAWFITQKPSTQQLWGECMKAERFGENFNELTTRLSENSFYEAKKAIEGKLFEFQPIQKLTKSGRYKIKGWKVRNLHGSSIHEYWNTAVSLVPQNLGEEEVSKADNKLESSTTSSTVSYPNNYGELPQNLGEEKPVALDTTAFDSPLLSIYNSSIISNEKNEESRISSRSGCSEQDPFTKVTGSAPAPDALITHEENPEAKPTYLDSSKKDLEHGLEGELGRQEDKVPVQKMTDYREPLNTPPSHVETPQFDVPPESPQSLPDPWDTQSDTSPSEPSPLPHLAPDANSPESVYIDAKLKLLEMGLLIGKGYSRLAKFESELKGGRLYPIANFVVLRWSEMPPGMVEDLATEYLLCDRDEDAWYVCVKDSQGDLQLMAL